MVKSKNAVQLTKIEWEAIIQKVKELNKTQLKKFREEFNPNEMGFAGREEGI